MSIASDCGPCLNGDHAHHDRDHGIRKGLIGGTYCGCTGGCAERAKDRAKRLSDWLSNPATPPADDTNRAPVSGGLGEGDWQRVEDVLIALWQCETEVGLWFHAAKIKAVLSRIFAVRDAAWVAATGEPDAEHARLSMDDLAAMADAARAEGSIEGQMRHITAEMARGDQTLEAKEELIADLRARVSHAEAERDTARREAGERIAVAIEAQWANDPGWHPFIRETANHAARIARAEARS